MDCKILEELSLEKVKSIILHCDNQSAIHIAKNPVFHDRTKHIEVDCHFTRDKVLEGLIQLSYLPTKHQLADVLTKILPSTQFKTLLSKLGMVYPHPSLREDVKYKTTDIKRKQHNRSTTSGSCLSIKEASNPLQMKSFST